ncbi:large ribosomal RNA subunit accumulation protein YCED homolog 2, chloroplastic isoform X2 [Carica papaya]|nr:large ribosomal RNA subunit accumulation protein YCED homolog 2, chloroplastic isoform X2 [Carica papaya]
MAEASHLVSPRNLNPFPATKNSSVNFLISPRIRYVSRKYAYPLSAKWKSPSRLITISTSDGKWHGKWSYDYLLSLQELNLQDLVEDEHNPDAMVSINLCIQKHASFGLSVDGRIITSFTRKCSNCFAPYCRQIDTNFKVWVLPSSKDDGEIQLPEIGGDDPSVIYVKPGYEAHLDSLVQDTLRLATSSQDSCSESCAKAEPKLH